TWEWVGNIPLGQFYQIFADNAEPFYHLSGGLQDNGSWTGPSRNNQGAILNSDWTNVSGGGGFHVVQHLDQPWLFLSESQGGRIVPTDLRTLQQQGVRPQPRRNDRGPLGEPKYRFPSNPSIP